MKALLSRKKEQTVLPETWLLTLSKRKWTGQVQWLMSLIPATWEAEIQRMAV
jgi:hypothetical protein